jgi:hypothetical protein
MIAIAPPRIAATSAAAGWTSPPTLRGRRQTARRRRLVMLFRDWLGIGVIACFSVTLFAVTYLSLLGR